MGTTITRNGKADLALERYQIPLMSWRNADGTVLDATGGAGLFKIDPGGWGSGILELEGEEADNGQTKTDTIMCEVTLPPSYIPDADVKLVVQAKYSYDVDDATAHTIDCEAYELSDAGAAAAIRASSTEALTTSFADVTFTLTDTNLVAGDRILLLVRTIITAAVGSPKTCRTHVGATEVQLDRKAA